MLILRLSDVMSSVCAYLQGMYCLTLEFKSKLEISVREERLPKIQNFFGPGGGTWELIV